MTGARPLLKRALQSSPAVRLRTAAGRFVVPAFHPYIARLDEQGHRLDHLESRVHNLDEHLPVVLNAIASTNGTARLLRRELDEQVERLGRELDSHVGRLDAHVRDELWPAIAKIEGLTGLADTVEWLVGRVETVRAEALHELHHGPAQEPGGEPRIVNPDKLASYDGLLRINLGCGHLPMDDYVNIDLRELPGVDVVSHIGDLPFDERSVGEIYSAHTLEHFTEAELRESLLPYWLSLLSNGGSFRAVVPDIDAMMEDHRAGRIPFDQLRRVIYGGQDYDGDYHFTAFTPDSLKSLLEEAGFSDIEILERGRANGECLEFEIVAHRNA